MPAPEREEPYDFVAIGGGAAGFFGAIAFAEARPGSRVLILEKTASVLGKVRISGGGRCNVTHACYDPRELVSCYPRGEKSLIGPFHRFSTGDTIEWFESRGVELKTEGDGRIFPTTDESATIIGCLARAADEAGVEVRTRTEVAGLHSRPDGWGVQLADGSEIPSRAVLVASGGTRNGADVRFGSETGHATVPAVPSLFTFRIEDPRIEGLAGLSVENVAVAVEGSKLRSEGPCLVTHWGLSGPAILKLSAWGARELADLDYRFRLRVNWTGTETDESARAALQRQREDSPKRKVATGGVFPGIPSRLWKRLVAASGIGEDVPWTNLSREARQALERQLVDSVFEVDGKSLNKEEFVTAGGIELREVDFRTLESRHHSGLYYAGEVLDIDGITGGFNFQAAWTTAYLAGTSAAAAAEEGE